MKNVVIYHNNCFDGLAAAWVALKALPEPLELIPLNYGDDYSGLPEKIKGNRVWVLDFSFKRELMEQYKTIAEMFLVLDHHKTAQADCEGLPYCIFDMNHSGAYLAWQHWHLEKPVPKIIQYIEDRDLWKWQLPNSKEINAVIQSHPKTFETMDMLNKLIEVGLFRMISDGELILRLEQGHIEGAIKYPILMKIAGHVIPVINNPNLISQTVERLCDSWPFAAAFFLRQDGKLQFSLRSRKPNGIDVSTVAKLYGGGGHPQASGFEINSSMLATMFVNCTECGIVACYKNADKYYCPKCFNKG